VEGLNETLVSTTFVIGSYAVGSIPFGLLTGKLIKGIDIREYGSGSTGATNVARTCGTLWGLLVLMLDMGKAAMPLSLAIYIIGAPEWSHPFMGIATILGHVYPIFTSFKGGKGVASGWAALIVLSPWAGLAATISAGPIIAVTRYVSWVHSRFWRGWRRHSCPGIPRLLSNNLRDLRYSGSSCDYRSTSGQYRKVNQR